MQIREDTSSLDPQDWGEFSKLAHQMVDDMIAGVRELPGSPVWRQMPDDVQRALQEEHLPRKAQGAGPVYEDFIQMVKPYRLGNPHPRFYGWYMGPGMPLASMADMLASDLDPNCTGMNSSATWVEAKIVDWMKEAIGYDPTASGILSTGGSMGNLTALNVARHAKAGFDVRKVGLYGGPRLTLYGSTETHSWVLKAAELLGLGSEAFRPIPVDENYQIDLMTLREKIRHDRNLGFRPICVVANVGTVNTGAVDDLRELALVCKEEDLWLHADGAFGALAAISPKLRSLVEGLEKVDSVVFDLHKWMYLPFEIACTLVKDPEAHQGAFAREADYLASFDRGLVNGPLRFAETGYELSRGFKALKAWMCLKAYGLDRFSSAIERNVELGHYLASLVNRAENLELLAPTSLNIVCFRYVRADISDLNAFNKELLTRLQERGLAAPSSTVLHSQFAIRAAIVNHRTGFEDMDALVADVVKIGTEM